MQLQEVAEHKTQLISSVSHELRTPLNSSLCMTQLCLQDNRIPDEVKQEYLKPSLFS